MKKITFVLTIVLCFLYDYGMSEIGGDNLPRGNRVVKAAKVGAAIAVAGAGVAALAKGIHDEQGSLAARIDYNAANQRNEQRQEAHHTTYFKQRREDDGFTHTQDGQSVEVFNRIVLQDGENLSVYKDPSQTSDRIEGFQPIREYDGTILGTPVYGDPFLTKDGKGMSDVTLKIGDRDADAVGYYQKIKGITPDGKIVEGFVMENSSLHVVKSIKDPTRNQGVIKVDLTK